MAGGLLLVLGAVFFFLHPYPRGGMDVTHYTLTLMAFTGVVGAIVAVHLALGHQLWHGPVAGSTGQEPRVARIRRKARS